VAPWSFGIKSSLTCEGHCRGPRLEAPDFRPVAEDVDGVAEAAHGRESAITA